MSYQQDPAIIALNCQPLCLPHPKKSMQCRYCQSGRNSGHELVYFCKGVCTASANELVNKVSVHIIVATITLSQLHKSPSPHYFDTSQVYAANAMQAVSMQHLSIHKQLVPIYCQFRFVQLSGADTGQVYFALHRTLAAPAANTTRSVNEHSNECVIAANHLFPNKQSMECAN